jgi:hypothetical protein
MGAENTRTGTWKGISDGLADEMQAVAGLILGRSTALHAIGDTTLSIEGTHRFTENGTIVVGSTVYYYTGKTATTLLQVTTVPTGVATGVATIVKERDVVALLSGDATLGENASPVTDMDKLKLGFFVTTAEGSDLDRIGRSYGLTRPRGLDDTRYRKFLMVMIALDASTIYAMHKVLDVVPGPGNYTVTEDEWNNPNEVFVEVSSSQTDSYRGKAFMTHRAFIEPADLTWTPGVVNALTLPAASPLVYGVWAKNDPDRRGHNYLEASFPCRTHEDHPRMVDSIVGDQWQFSNIDLGKGCRFTNPPGMPVRSDYWNVNAIFGPIWAQLSKDVYTGGITTVGFPERLMSAVPVFESWMVGSAIQVIDSTRPTNIQRATIASVSNARTVNLSNFSVGEPFVPFLSDQGGVSFTVFPKFVNNHGMGGQNLMIHIDRSTRSVDDTIVYCPIPDIGGQQLDPTGVWVDYTTIPSAQAVLSPTQEAVDQYAFYLWDEHELVRSLLDTITAAGVRPTLIEEEV